jgi:ERF superfamily
MNDIAIDTAGQSDLPPRALRTSQVIDKLAAALAIAQGAWENPPRDREVIVQTRTGSSYKFKYATLSAVLDATRKPLAENGLSITHVLVERNGRNRLISRLMHASGQWMESEFPLFVTEQTNQALGSALTYAKRYSRCALLDIAADEDDDGNAADGNTAQGRDRQQRQRLAPSLAIPEPPHDPETGELLAPHTIPVPTDARGRNWIRWGATLIAAFKATKDQAELDAWVEKNAETMTEAQSAAAKAFNSINGALAAARARIGPEEPEMLGADETEGVLR